MGTNIVKSGIISKVITDMQSEAKDKLEEAKPDIIKKFLTERTGEEHGRNLDFIVNFNNEFLLQFDILIISLAIWNSVFIPLEIAFEPTEVPAIVLINATIELFFIIDIGLAFRTSYLTHDG